MLSSNLSRREVMERMAFLGAALVTPGVFAEELLRTPPMTEGPFYPDKLPLDTDNDLLILNDSLTPAVGEITHLSGRILGPSGKPIRNAFVEIWQVDHHGVYLHSGSDGAQKRDANFQGYGRFLTDSSGAYYFRTIKPVPYPGRTPHIHVAISQNGRRVFTTQLFVKGHPHNERDGLLQRIGDPHQRESLLVDFKPLKNSKLGELEAAFDVVLGSTPEDGPPEEIRGGIGRPQWSAGPVGRPPRSPRPPQ